MVSNDVYYCYLIFHENRTFGKIHQKGVKWVKAKKMAQNIPKIHDIRHNSCLLDGMSLKLGSNVS